MPATEVLQAVLLPGGSIGDPENHAAKIFKETVDLVSKQDGVHHIHFGMRVENPDTLQLVVEWETLKHHQDFMASNVYPPFVERFFSTTTGPSQVELIHVDFKPQGGLLKALSAPITSVAKFHFKDGKPPSDYESSAAKFFESLGGPAPGEQGHAIGLTDEDIESSGSKGRGAVLIVGWDSTDAYDKFHKSALFKDNARYIGHGVGEQETHLVQFMKALPS